MKNCPHCKMPISNRSSQRTPTGIEDKYLNHTLPALIREMNDLNSKLEKIADVKKEDKAVINSVINSITGIRFYEVIGSDFFKTRAGNKFFNHTMPTLIKEIERLNENLEGAGKND